MTIPEISSTLLSWMEVASKRKMMVFRKSLCDCRDIIDGLLDGYPQYVMAISQDVRDILAHMQENVDNMSPSTRQSDEGKKQELNVIAITKAFEEKMKEFT